MANGIVANSALNAAAGMLLLVTGFACSIIAARFLGPEANGIIAFSLWLATTGALVAELGTGVLLLRMLPQLSAQGYDEHRRRGFAALLLTPTLISTAVLAILYAVVFLGSEELHWAKTAPSIALVTGVLFVIQSIGAFTKNYLIGEQRLRTYFKLTIIASIAQLALVLGGTLTYGVEGALIGYAAGQVVMFLYTFTIVFKRRDLCGVPMKFLVSSSLMLSAGFVIDSIFLNRIEILYLQQFWSVEMVGYYAVSLSLANLALQLPVQLTGSLLPYYAQRRHSDGGEGLSAETFSGVIRALSYITLPMSFGLAAISTQLVVSVFGEAFRPAGPMVALLALSSPAFVLMMILTQYLFALDRTKTRLYVGIFGAIIIVVGCAAAVPYFGGEGAAAVRILAFSAMCLAMIRATGFGKSLTALYWSIAKVTGAAVIVGIVSVTVEEPIGGPLGLVLAVIAGVIAYPFALRFLGAVPAEDGRIMLNIANRLPGRLRSGARAGVLFISPRAGDPEVDPTRMPAEGAGREAAVPVAIDNGFALYMTESESSEPRDTAVLLLPPWGFEDLCARKFYRILAEHLADQGIPSLRFDYPGTGDALGNFDDPITLADWEKRVRVAASCLLQTSGRSRLVLVGQGVGGMLAERVSRTLPDLAGVGLLAPALSGRAWLRELAIWSKIVDQGLGLRDEQRDTENVSIASFRMPAQVADAIRKINLAGPETAGAPDYLLLERPVRLNDTSFADALRQAGARVSLEAFEGYDDLVANPTIQKMPMESVGKIVDWASSISAPLQSRPVGLANIGSAAQIGPHFVERAVRFGAGNHLIGVFCIPEMPMRGTPVLLLSTAYDRSAGWGRSGVAIARELAENGIASFRYDTANVGDSAPAADAPSQVLYSTTQNDDVTAAIDLMQQTLGEPLMVAGRCSGAYLAIRSAVADRRINAVVSVNPFAFYWDPEVPVDAGLQFVPRSLDDYGQRMVRLETFKRVLRGQINVRSAAKNIIIAICKRIAHRLTPLIGRLPSKVHNETVRTMQLLQKRNVPVSLLYSEGDVGLDALHKHFGNRGEGLDGLSNVTLTMLADTDHNLTPPQSRRVQFEEILRLAQR